MLCRPFITLLLCTAASHAAVDYTTQIKPLLHQHCVKCHGATTQKSQLKLDTAAGARTGGKRGSALPDLLVQVISGTHAEIPQMPYKRGPLDSSQIALIRRWVAEGAHAPADETPSDDRHWAFIAPVKAPLPPNGTTHPIDAFIRASLTKASLEPSPPAAPATLIRRPQAPMLLSPGCSPPSTMANAGAAGGSIRHAMATAMATASTRRAACGRIAITSSMP